MSSLSSPTPNGAIDIEDFLAALGAELLDLRVGGSRLSAKAVDRINKSVSEKVNGKACSLKEEEALAGEE